MKTEGMRKKLCLSIGALAIFVLLLKIANWLPLMISEGSVRRYPDVETARKAAWMDRVYLPSFFPERIEWPPTEIFGRRKPAPAVLMHFRNRENGRIVLSISQHATGSAPIPSRIDPAEVMARKDVTLKSLPAELSLAVCRDGHPCNTLTWRQDGAVLRVVDRGPVDELREICESMVWTGETASPRP